jgi:uncharacterized protein (TIGR02147 family)
MADMLAFFRGTDPKFSVHAATKNLRRVSPALVTLVLKRKRRLTQDRAEEFAKLLKLDAAEGFYFKNWIANLGGVDFVETSKTTKSKGYSRREVSTSILNDWINIFVKDSFQIPDIQKDPKKIYQRLAHLTNAQRIDRSLKFLLKEGHLRRKLNGEIVLNENLSVADPKVPNKKIRQFHKGALKVAQLAIDLFPPEERLANALILPLDEERYKELMQMIEAFAESLKHFAAQDIENPKQLYQILINLSPVGVNTK